MKDKSGFNYLMAPIISIIAFLLLIGGASYAYFTQSVGSTTGAANIANANLTVPRGCTFIANATNCVITANNATTTAFTDSVITRAEMSQAHSGSSVAQSTCNLNIGVQGTAGCKCNYTVSLEGQTINNYIFDSLKVNINKGTTAQALLPTEYQQVEYIEYTGAQFIDTGFRPDYSKDFSFSILFSPEATGYRYVLASDYSGTLNTSLEINASNAFRFYRTTADIATVGTITANSLNLATLSFTKSSTTYYMYLNGATKSASVSTLTGQDTNSMYLFVDYSKRYTTFNHKIKVYKSYITENGAVVKYFVPCYRKSDNAIGMYELVGKTFIENGGTTPFNKGSNVTSTEFDVEAPYYATGTISVATTGTAVYQNFAATLKAYNINFSQNDQAGKSFVYRLKANPTCTVS